MKAGRATIAHLVATLLVTLAAACSRDDHTAPLVAPYDDDDTLGTLTAVWHDTGEERGFAGGTRLKEPEVRVGYRLDARNRSGNKLFVRLGDMQLVDAAGLALGRDTTSIECALNAGDTDGVLTSDVWVPRSALDQIHTFRIARLAVPLGERPLKRYREWLLQGRRNDAPQVDAEIAKQAAAPPCTGQ